MSLFHTQLLCFPIFPRYTSVSSQLHPYSRFWILAASYRHPLAVYGGLETALTMTATPHTGDNHRTASRPTMTTTLVFDSTEELQTRLVLLPRIEEEGVGAIVEHYVPRDKGDDEDEPRDANRDTERIRGTVVGSILANDDKGDESELVDLKDLDFAEILAALRSAKPPVRLQLVYDPTEEEIQNNEDSVVVEQSADESSPPVASEDDTREAPEGKSSTTEPVFEEEKKVDPADMESSDADKDHRTDPSQSENEPSAIDDKAASMQSSLMSWASRFSASSVQMATERAQQAMEVAAERRKAAAAVMASSMSPLRTRTASADISAEAKQRLDVDMFIQTSSGAFLPLPQEKQKLSSELRVTNSSVLTIRKSAAKACSPDEYSFQWYRSLERPNTGSTPEDNNTIEWVELPGATSRVFQPTATEVGHKIRCVVTKLGDGASSDDDDYNDKEEGSADEKSLSACLETFECVSAALTLFNGARQALVKGAHFGGIKGQRNLSDRTFRIKVSMSITKDPETRKSKSTSSLCFYQVSGSTSESMHPEEEPITGVTAVADHESAKGFELVLPDDMPESAALVRALATDGRLPLLASNRHGRESLLLSIGIAKYAGEPSTLGPACVLYFDVENTIDSEAEASVGQEEPEPTTNIVENEDETSSVPEPADRPPLIPKSVDSIQRRHSLDAPLVTDHEDAQRVKELERELNALRSRLSKKDKAMTDLQKQVQTSDAACDKLGNDLTKRENELKETKRNLLVAERRMQSQEDDMKRMRSDQTKAIESLNKELDSRAASISELEKTVRILQNEKTVLSATVEARDSKLAKMATLQSSLDEMKTEVSKTDELRNQLEQASQKYSELSQRFDMAEGHKEEVLRELEDARKKALKLEDRTKLESQKSESCRIELDTLQMKIQKLKAERNNYKQKSDSLSKEISRVCRQGRTIKDVEKIISDDVARRQEVELLREQKRKALEDLNHYRTAYEQARAAQRLAGIDHETSKIYERNAELERLLSELTEYVSAKEMQLETLKEINDTLQEEIKDLHKSMMSKNLGSHDV